MSHLARGGGGLTPNETLSLSNGKFVFDHGPKIDMQLKAVISKICLWTTNLDA